MQLQEQTNITSFFKTTFFYLGLSRLCPLLFFVCFITSNITSFFFSSLWHIWEHIAYFFFVLLHILKLEYLINLTFSRPPSNLPQTCWIGTATILSWKTFISTILCFILLLVTESILMIVFLIWLMNIVQSLWSLIGKQLNGW